MKEIENLVELGRRLQSSAQLEEKIESAQWKNPWFVPAFTHYAFNAIISDMLNEQKLSEWISRPHPKPLSEGEGLKALTAYPLKPIDKTIGLIFAGNVPLVGFHDFLCAYVCGCRMKIKLSSKDEELFPFVLNLLAEIDPQLNQRVEIVERLSDFDAVIATGSNNTNRYFEYYFRNYPKILRKNRNSVAILTGEESPDDLAKLADDIFLYFGLGCRSVSKIYVPTGYDLKILFPCFSKYSWLHQHGKYLNNYDYNRTLYLMNKTPHLANEFIMVTENPSIPSPIATLHYESWHDKEVLVSNLKHHSSEIQCIVTLNPEAWPLSSCVPIGQSQHPELWDYADGVDTMAFLLGL
jgi:hypothetical protein